MKTEFKTYRFKKFPITFLYPAYAKYRRFNEKKHSKQVIIREEKNRYGKNESGKTVFIYPKLCITVLRVYVPAYQTNNRQSYIMGFEDYLNKLQMIESKKSAFPDMICNDMGVSNHWKGIQTIYQHPNNSYWRTEIYLAEILDDTKIVNIMYRHIGKGRSDEELDAILESFEPVHITE
ncbi:MAG: hypothetical protein PVI99_06515 [Anaerolineales bacterium]|jgi:hypothetical protein